MGEHKDRNEETEDQASHVKGDIGTPDGEDLDLPMKESKNKAQPDTPETIADEVEMNKS